MKTLKEKIEVMQAYLDGKPIEFWSETKCQWMITNPPAFQWADIDYRVQPTLPSKKLVAMQPEDYPPIFWVRLKSQPDKQLLCTGIDGAWLMFSACLSMDHEESITTHRISGIHVQDPRPCEYSVDRKTWLPCTKEVEE